MKHSTLPATFRFVPNDLGRRHLFLLLLFSLLTMATARAQSGDEFWDGRLGPPGVTGEVKVIAVSGDDVYVGGEFQRAGNLQVNNIARWNRTQHRWFPLGHGSAFDIGVNGGVLAITVDAGKVYVGGQFSHAGGVESGNIALYDPASDSWSAFGGGGSSSSGTFISAIAVKGSDVYVGGSFAALGTLLANNVARWDGTKWNRLGAGLTGQVYTFASVSSDLYAGGAIDAADGNQASNLVRWDGTAWSNVSSGTDGPVRVIVPFSGDLIIGGSFSTAGSISASSIARYTIATGLFTPFGTGIGHPDPQLTPSVNAIVAVGSDLYVGGDFRRAGTDSAIARHVARWNGSEWLALNQPNDTLGRGVGSNRSGFSVVNAMVNVGGELYIGGVFDNAYMRTGIPQPAGDNVSEGYSAKNIVRWDLTVAVWRSLAEAPNGPVRAMASFGNDIVIGGRFTSAGGVDARNVARWDYRNGVWSSLGSGLDSVDALAAAGDNVYAGVGTKVYRWNGSSWMSLGAPLPGRVMSLAVAGPSLYAGTEGTTGGPYAWNGTSWSGVGGGVNGSVLTISPDQSGGIFVGGEFTMAGGVSASNIAYWNGSQWSALGAGTNGAVHSIAQGVGAIYIGGDFTSAGDEIANRVVQYDAPTRNWITLGNGLDATVRSVAYQNGTIYAAGDFVTTGGVTVRSVAQFDGETWTELGRGTNGPVRAMIADNSSIVVAGDFDIAGVTPSYGFGRWSRTVAAAPLAIDAGGLVASINTLPNPADGDVSVAVTLDRSARVSLRIIDALGRRVTTLHDGVLASGLHVFQWDSRMLSAGIYFCQLQHGMTTISGKIVVKR